jgi:hypothetical protein
MAVKVRNVHFLLFCFCLLRALWRMTDKHGGGRETLKKNGMNNMRQET